jgi:hypothetical protein
MATTTPSVGLWLFAGASVVGAAAAAMDIALASRKPRS